MAERTRSLYRRSQRLTCSVAAAYSDCRHEAPRTGPQIATALWLGSERLAIDMPVNAVRRQCPPTRENLPPKAWDLPRVRRVLCP